MFDEGMEIERQHEEKLIELAEATTSELFEHIAKLEAELTEEKALHKSLMEHHSATDKSLQRLRDERGALVRSFEEASRRISTGKTKQLDFRCSHCGKDTPLLIDGLLDATRKEIKDGTEQSGYERVTTS